MQRGSALTRVRELQYRTAQPSWRDLLDIEERGRDVLRVREASGVWSNRGYNDVALRRQNIMAI